MSIDVDLHSHPTLRPFNMNKDVLFEKDPIIRIDNPINYSEDDLHKIASGNVRIVFASLYPVEQGFFITHQFGTGDFDDLLISILLNFPKDWINQIYSL